MAESDEKQSYGFTFPTPSTPEPDPIEDNGQIAGIVVGAVLIALVSYLIYVLRSQQIPLSKFPWWPHRKKPKNVQTLQTDVEVELNMELTKAEHKKLCDCVDKHIDQLEMGMKDAQFTFVLKRIKHERKTSVLICDTHSIEDVTRIQEACSDGSFKKCLLSFFSSIKLSEKLSMQSFDDIGPLVTVEDDDIKKAKKYYTDLQAEEKRKEMSGDYDAQEFSHLTKMEAVQKDDEKEVPKAALPGAVSGGGHGESQTGPKDQSEIQEVTSPGDVLSSESGGSVIEPQTGPKGKSEVPKAALPGAVSDGGQGESQTGPKDQSEIQEVTSPGDVLSSESGGSVIKPLTGPKYQYEVPKAALPGAVSGGGQGESQTGPKDQSEVPKADLPEVVTCVGHGESQTGPKDQSVSDP